MGMSATGIAGSAVTAIGVIVLGIAIPVGIFFGIAVPEGSTVQSVPKAQAAALTTATDGGVTLHSVNVDLPNGDRTFPGDAKADAINNNCLACHSAGMVLNQPSLSRAAWQAEVEKMRSVYLAPIAAEDVSAIVDYLASLGKRE